MKDFRLKELFRQLVALPSSRERKEWDEEEGQSARLEQLSRQQQEQLKERMFRRIAEKANLRVEAKERKITPYLGAEPFYRQQWFRVAAVLMFMAVSSVTLLHFEQDLIQQTSPATITRTAGIGQRLTLNLPDGTSVVLNSGSTLSYPEVFGHVRAVTLSGEAFFKVKHDAQRPFTVSSGSMITRVLGTSFNVQAYATDRRFRVTVVSGKVAVNLEKNTTEELILTPGMQAVYDRDMDHLTGREVLAENFASWKEGRLVFSDCSMGEMTDVLQRWYGVEFRYANESARNCRVVLSTFDNMPLTRALEIIGNSAGLSLKRYGRVIFVTGNSCDSTVQQP